MLKKIKMNHSLFSGDAKMADLVMTNGRLLYILPCFDIKLGFKEKTIKQICEEAEVPLPFRW